MTKPEDVVREALRYIPTEGDYGKPGCDGPVRGSGMARRGGDGP